MEGGSFLTSLATSAKVQWNLKYLRNTNRKTFTIKERVGKLEEIGFDWDKHQKI